MYANFKQLKIQMLNYCLQMASGHLAHSHYDDADVGVASAKKRRVVSSRIERPKGVASNFRQVDISDVQEVLYIHSSCNTACN